MVNLYWTRADSSVLLSKTFTIIVKHEKLFLALGTPKKCIDKSTTLDYYIYVFSND